jgi:hypothetical protein
MKNLILPFVYLFLRVEALEALELPDAALGGPLSNDEIQRIPSASSAQASVPGTLSLDLTNRGTEGYALKIKAGTPPQEMTLVIDTGSSDTFLLSKEYTFPGVIETC